MTDRPVDAEDDPSTWPAEALVDLEPPHVDERGAIQPLVDRKMLSALMISSTQGALRANHYHRTDWHYCYVLDGSIEYLHRPTGSRAKPKRVFVKEGELFFTPPMVDHQMIFPEKATFLVLSRNSREQEVYEADVVRIPPLRK